MRLVPSLKGSITPVTYAIVAASLLLSQHLAVALALRVAGSPVVPDIAFWLLPLRRLAMLPSLASGMAVPVFAYSMTVSWALATLSFRRASRSGFGYVLAALSIVPAVQIAAVLILIVLPTRPVEDLPPPEAGTNIAHVLQGLFSGIAIIILAVLVSAVTFGAYGWGLFVMTPFLVGVTTAYVANRTTPLPKGRTFPLVMAAAALGTLALVFLALEGFVCILLAAPLGAAAAAVGGALGRSVALAGHRRNKPLMSIALLPAVFALEAAMPPAVPIAMREQIVIAAPPAAVWHALTSSDRIATPPGLVGRAGLAYPIRGRLLGTGVGAERLGEFSTGTAIERVTEWQPGRRLTFTVLTQPPAMEEMSPYRRVHSPHVLGYFLTAQTSFDLKPMPGGRTSLTATASHTLRMDPVLYWEPMARLAIHLNVRRVLDSIKDNAEHRSVLQAPAHDTTR